MADDAAWRIPLYGVLWMLVDAIVDHRLGSEVDGLIETAMRDILRANGVGPKLTAHGVDSCAEGRLGGA